MDKYDLIGIGTPTFYYREPVNVRNFIQTMEEGEIRLACHLAEWAWLSSPQNNKVSEKAAKVFIGRAKNETSTMAIGIFLAAARQMGGDPEEEMPGRTVVQAQELRKQ